MRRNIKKHNLLPLVLLVYLIVNAVIAFPAYRSSGNWNEFFSIIGLFLLLALVLYFVLKKKQQLRNRFTNNDSAQ